jgi:paraquat-inducible protein A
MPTTGAFLACHECDLLQHEVRLAPGGVARCHRCGAQLYRSRPHELDRVPAYTLGAFILYVVSNAFPIVGLSVNGELVQVTLLGAVDGIYADGDWLVAFLVLVTAVIAPFVQMIATTWLLLLLRMGRVPKNFAKVFRVLAFTRPWGMVEVLMIGVMVALVKLAHMAEVVPGIALWSLAGSMLLLAAAGAAFDPHFVWSKVSGAR